MQDLLIYNLLQSGWLFSNVDFRSTKKIIRLHHKWNQQKLIWAPDHFDSTNLMHAHLVVNATINYMHLCHILSSYSTILDFYNSEIAMPSVAENFSSRVCFLMKFCYELCQTFLIYLQPTYDEITQGLGNIRLLKLSLVRCA